jgi:hypothetical protein
MIYCERTENKKETWSFHIIKKEKQKLEKQEKKLVVKN